MREPHIEQVAHLPVPTFHQLPPPSPLPLHDQSHEGEVTVVRDVQQRPQYNELAVGTNLAVAPRNWLTDDRRLVPVSNRGFTQDTSTTIALSPSVEITNFSDEEVDFIAPAENIKKIFKIPYSKAGISLVVHKIGRTIVLDKLSKEDAGYFAQPGVDTSSRFTEIVEDQQQQTPPPSPPRKPTSPDESFKKAKKKNQTKAIEDALYSKFLYYTLLAKDQEKKSEEKEDTDADSNLQSDEYAHLPKPSKTFSRLFRWRFRDQTVLFGTDMVIFSRENQPSVSIRLRDVDKKMSVLTTLDYWLDNIMANVPMVAICNHRGGYVQGYQFMNTEDLPRSHPNLTFHPGVVQEHAHQVLKFIQSNCTQETGTYWLYKGVGDQSLKLYNVSHMAKQSTQAQEPAKKERPFALPVGMMCYTLATKILQQNKPDSRTRAKDLLEKCLEMLDETKFPGVWAYAQEKMADTISNFPLPALFGTQTPAQFSADKSPTKKEPPLTVALLKNTLYSISQCTEQEQLAGAENQFITAVHHLSKGINALAHLENEPKHKIQVLSMKSKAAYCYYQLAKIQHEKGKYGAALHWLQLSSQSIRSQQPQTPEQKIFFGALSSLCADIYVGISANINADNIKTHQNDLDFSESPKFSSLEPSKVPLLPPASTIPSLPPPPSSTPTTASSPSTPPSTSPSASSSSSPSSPSPSSFSSSSPSSSSASSTPSISSTSEIVQIREPLTLDVEENLRTAVSYYLKALGFVSNDVDLQEYTNLTKRLGNAQNQLGIHYMNTARFTKAAWHFQLAVDTFKQIKDQPNIALIYCNIGKLMKVYAQNERMGLTPPLTPSPSPSSSSAPPASTSPPPAAQPPSASSVMVTSGDDVMSDKEQSHYEKAIGFYENAKEALKDRKSYPAIWDAVQSQLAATYLIMGLRTAAAPDSAQADPDQAKLACEHLLKALKMYDSLKDTYQVALTHLHLGALYGKMIRNGDSETERRSRIKVAMLHFEKALSTFTPDQYPKEFVCVKYELAQMYEQMPIPSHPTRMAYLAKALRTLLDTADLFRKEKPKKGKEKGEQKTDFVKANEGLTRTNEGGQVKTKVEEILKQMLKLAAPAHPPSHSSSHTPSHSSSHTPSTPHNVNVLKQLYKDVLSAQTVGALGEALAGAKESVDKMM